MLRQFVYLHCLICETPHVPTPCFCIFTVSVVLNLMLRHCGRFSTFTASEMLYLMLRY